MLFLVMCCTLGIQSFAGIFFYHDPLLENRLFGFSIINAAFVLYLSTGMHFIAELTQWPKNRLLIISMYIPALVLLIKNIHSSYLYTVTTYTNRIWVFKIDFNIWTILFIVFCLVHTLFILFSLFLWYKTASTYKSLKQAKILSTSLIFALTASTADSILLPAVSSYQSLSLTPLFLVIWIAGIGYSILKYRLLVITPEIASYEIIQSIDEIVLLLNHRGQIIFVNKTFEETTGYSLQNIYEKSINSVINCGKMEKCKSTANTELEFITDSGPFVCSFECSTVCDDLGDNTGFMIIAKPMMNAAQLKKKFRLTGNEIKILSLFRRGAQKSGILEVLDISEVTLKAHLTKIYRKCGVKNKVQLINLLQGYRL